MKKDKEVLLSEIVVICARKKGECLSDKYIDNKTKLKFKCEKGHIFECNPNNIKSGKWCKQCATLSRANKRRNTIDNMKALAKERGGECLSTEYINSSTPIAWRCNKCDHEWMARPGNIRTGHWCPKCAEQNRLNAISKKKFKLEYLQSIANSRRGKCLSREYKNSTLPLDWQCEYGHQWSASAGQVVGNKSRLGTWCPICSSRKLNINDMHNLASKHGGKCLSIEYNNLETKLTWKCDKGHIWETTPAIIKNGSWCRKCANEKKKYTIEELENKAKMNGGELITKVYNGATTKIEWKCSEGHTFLKSPTKVMTCDEWCNKCNKYITQERCRYILETLTNKTFNIDRNELDGLELDGYNDELKLAFEYNGRQHNEFDKFFHKDKNSLKRIKERDKLKQELCKNKGIKLIVIPFNIKKTADNDNIFNYIVDKLKEFKIEIVYDISQFSYNSFWYSISKLNEAKKIAKMNNCECVSKEYINAESNIEWKCNECNYIWTRKLRDARKELYCMKCKKRKLKAKRDEENLDKLKKIAAFRHGECLAERYISDKIKIEWKCKEGHKWFTSPASIKTGSWCVVCSKKKKIEFEEINEIIKCKGGICLTQPPITRKSNLTIECRYKHIFIVKAERLRQKYRCPTCDIISSSSDDYNLDNLFQAKGCKLVEVKPKINTSLIKLECNLCGKNFQGNLADFINRKFICSCNKNKDNTTNNEINHKDISSLSKKKKSAFLIGSKEEKLIKLKNYAIEKDGECLSIEYKNSEEKLKWHCKICNYIWEANAKHVLIDKSWCPKCAIEKNAASKRGSIKEMQLLAKERGGKCLSSIYTNARKKLIWECKEGHRWEATPDYIKNRNKWCKYCKL